MKLQLSIQDTNVLKGIALLLLLWHHLFYSNANLIDDIDVFGHSLIQVTAAWAKVCVAVFVFLSGYGLNYSADQRNGLGNVWAFYKNRYLKLMSNYWFIYFIFVPFGVFVMGRTFEMVYAGSLFRALLDFFGLHFAVTMDFYGYNATWWFYGCIIMLYLLFPLMYKYKEKWGLVVICCLLYSFLTPSIPLLHACYNYIFVFMIGMYFNRMKFPSTSNSKLLLTFLFILTCLLRFFVKLPFMWDSLNVPLGVMVYLFWGMNGKFKALLSFIGTHSFNIFLFHTFIFSIYFTKYIYWTRNPLMIYITLFTICILISILLEALKKKIGYYSILNKVIH